MHKPLKLLLLSQIMLLLALAFNAGLNIGSLKKVHTELITAKFHGVGLDSRIKIEKGVRLGKLLDKFVGLDLMIASVAKELPTPSSISIFGADENLISSTVGSVDEKELANIKNLVFKAYSKSKAQRSEKTEKELGSGEKHLTVKKAGNHFLIYPILGRGEVFSGLLVFSFSEEIIDQMVGEVIGQQTTVLAMTALTAMGVLALGLLLSYWQARGRSSQIQDSRAYWVVFLVLIGAQVYFSFHSSNLFRSEFISATKSQVETQSQLFKTDLENRILKRGVPIEKLRGLEKRLAVIVADNVDISSMQLLDLEGTVLNMANESGPLDLKTTKVKVALAGEDDEYQLTLPLHGKQLGKSDVHVGDLRTTLSRKEISSKVREIVYDSVTIIILSIMFILELKFFLLFFMNSTNNHRNSGSIDDPSPLNGAIEPYKFARPAAFLFLFAWALPLSFIPLKMQLLYIPIAGIEKELALGLPISVEMLCALVTALMAGGMTDRYGWHLPFIAGIILSSTGAIFSADATNALAFIGYRGIAGLGYGLAWMAIQGFIFHNSTDQNRSLGYSTLVAGIFAGHICGTAVGAMLAERLGYDLVFTVSAALMTLPMGFVLVFMSGYMRRPELSTSVPDVPVGDIVRLLFNKDFVSIMLLSVVPFSICQIGLLYYAVPIYLDAQQVSQSTIGRVLMVYGLSVVFIAPQISRVMDKSKWKKKYLVAGGLIGSLGLISLYFVAGLSGVLVAVFMLGLSSCFSGPAQPAIALKLKMAERVGRARSMSIQRAADKLGQMGGPLFVGFLVASVGIEKSVAYTGATFLVATFILLLVLREVDSSKE